MDNRGKLPAIDSCPSCEFDQVTCQQVGRLTWQCICGYCCEFGEKKSNAVDAINAWNNPNDITMLSTGSKEQDTAIMNDYKKHSSLLEDGICPNGCARLVQIQSHASECPVCKFVHTKVSLNA